MAPTYYSDEVLLQSSKQNKTSSRFFTCSVLRALFLDIVMYGVAFPLIGVYLAGCCAKMLDLGAKFELTLAVVLTFTLLHITIWTIIGEFPFWKHLLALEPYYKSLLLVRDAINCAFIILLMKAIHDTFENMVADQGMKTTYIGEGVSYVVLKRTLGRFNIDKLQIEDFGFRPNKLAGPAGKPGAEISPEIFEHGAELILLWAMLAASAAKFLYFNTLFTMSKAEELFMILKPSFMDEDDHELGPDYESVNFTFNENKDQLKNPDRLERDFVQAARIVPDARTKEVKSYHSST